MQNSRWDFLRLASRLSTLALRCGDSAARFCGSNTAGGVPPDHPSTEHQRDVDNASADSDPSHDLRRRIKAISNVFEVGRAEPDYAYVENLGDGRGYTVTQYGFCTYNNEVSDVIARYAEDVPATPLKRFLPHLPR